jgi:hypothetical protein
MSYNVKKDENVDIKSLIVFLNSLQSNYTF